MKNHLIVTLVVCAISLSGCAVARHMTNTDQCMAPTAREAKITKKVWM